MIISPNISFEIDDTGAREYDSMEDERPNEKGGGVLIRDEIFLFFECCMKKRHRVVWQNKNDWSRLDGSTR